MQPCGIHCLWTERAIALSIMKSPEAYKSFLYCEARRGSLQVPSCHFLLFPWTQERSKDSSYLPKISHRQAPYLPLPHCGFLLPESSGDSQCKWTCWQGSCRTQWRGADRWSPSACSSLACCNKGTQLMQVTHWKYLTVELVQSPCFPSNLNSTSFLLLSSSPSLTACWEEIQSLAHSFSK